LLIQAVSFEQAAASVPEPFCSELKAQAMASYHYAALDEKRRREAGEQPDDRHLTYL
jgi:hypothetical protein